LKTVECPAHVEYHVLASLFSTFLKFLAKCVRPSGCGGKFMSFSLRFCVRYAGSRLIVLF